MPLFIIFGSTLAMLLTLDRLEHIFLVFYQATKSIHFVMWDPEKLWPSFQEFYAAKGMEHLVWALGSLNVSDTQPRRSFPISERLSFLKAVVFIFGYPCGRRWLSMNEQSALHGHLETFADFIRKPSPPTRSEILQIRDRLCDCELLVSRTIFWPSYFGRGLSIEHFGQDDCQEFTTISRFLEIANKHRYR